MSDAIAVVPETPVAPDSRDALASLTETQRSKWLETGELPAAKTETKAAPSDEVPPVAAPADETTPPSEPPSSESPDKPKVAKPRHDINARLGQLAEQKRLEKERADRLEAELAELKQGKPAAPPKTDTTAQPKAPTYLELVKRYESAPEWPKLEDFVAAGFADPYQACNAAQAAFIQDQRTAEREQAAAQQSRQSRADQRIAAAFTKAREDAEFDESALAFDIPPSFAETLFESDLSAELLKYFSKHPSEGRALAAMEPLAAARAVGKLEASFASAVVSSPPATPKTVSSAPPPAQTLGSRHTSKAGDELEDAIRTHDVGRYIDLENQRELAARKNGGRR
jgi:hypothetical protein